MDKKLINKLNDKNFDEKILTNSMVLVDFWAEWCNPCKMLNPIIEEIANEYLDKLSVFKMNIDDNALTAPKYNVRSIPTLILFNKGKVLDTKVGLFSKNEIKSFLNKYLSVNT